MSKKKTIERPESVGYGDKVRDTVTGFIGITMARTEWLNGCVRWVIQPEAKSKDGSLPHAESFDEQQLVVLEKAVIPRPIVLHAELIELDPVKARKLLKAPGGPFPTPKPY